MNASIKPSTADASVVGWLDLLQITIWLHMRMIHTVCWFNCIAVSTSFAA
jgi:hypothetical protein